MKIQIHKLFKRLILKVLNYGSMSDDYVNNSPPAMRF